MIPRRGVKIKFFLSVVIPVVKAAFVPLSATGESPANAGVTRLCGVSPCPVLDTATALPNVAPYQLSHTRLFTFLPLYHGGEENQRFFCLWSFVWSKPLLCRFLQSGKILQTHVSQGFAAFHLVLSRIPPRHSQSKRATNCANPGFLVIEFCARCGQTCGQAVFLTISACGGSACIVGVSRDCGHCIFRLEGGATCSQTRRDTNFAIPRYY